MLTEFKYTKKKSSWWKWLLVLVFLTGLGVGTYFFMNKVVKKVKARGCPINPRQYIESLRSQSSDSDAL